MGGVLHNALPSGTQLQLARGRAIRVEQPTRPMRTAR